jgi:hypothetical protein
MEFSDAVTACGNLFKVQRLLAHGIIPALRIEDVKIALAKRLRALAAFPKGLTDADPAKEYLDSYGVLVEYIKQHNIEVYLALESHSEPAQEGSTYLFPHIDAGKSRIVSPVRSSVDAKKDLFYSGVIPPRKLRFGTYLYYRGIISYYNVMESIAWQKDRRPLIGQMAMQIGKLSADEFARIMMRVKNGECFGVVARSQQLLSAPVITTLVKAQEKYDCRIGRYFTEKKILTEADVRTLEEEMRLHNGKFGLALPSL